MTLAAFDPGSISGAVAITDWPLFPDQPQVRKFNGIVTWEVHDLPTMGAGKRVLLNGAAMAAVLTAAHVNFAVVEHVHSMPRQGVASMFKFGTAFGQILGVLQALGIPYELVPPQVWKKAMRLPGGDGKQEAARGRALELFPSLNDRLARKKDHNRAEALLMARWWLDEHNKGEVK